MVLMRENGINSLPDDKILDWSKLKQFADDNFKFDENSRKFFKRVENTVDKGEIAHYVFKRLASQGHQKVSLCGNGLKDNVESILEEALPHFSLSVSRTDQCISMGERLID